MVIIADENIDHQLINMLKVQHSVISVYYEMRGLSDVEIITLAQQQSAIILTEDKDFGEYVFAHKIKNISVVFLRYSFAERAKMFDKITQLFSSQTEKLLQKYTTITIHKIRTRDLL